MGGGLNQSTRISIQVNLQNVHQVQINNQQFDTRSTKLYTLFNQAGVF